MNKKSLDKILNYFREEAPTVNVGSGNIAGTAEAGDAPPVNLKKKKRPPIIARGKLPGLRKRWSKTHRITEGEIADKLRKVVADMKAADRKAGLLPGGKDVVDLDVERQRRRKKVEERFSNWRNEITLMEVPDDVPETDDEMQVRIKKKKVNNAKLIKINPNIGEEIKKLGGELLEMTEEEVQLEAKVDAGKSAAEKAKTRNLRNTPPGADKDTDLKTFITRKPGESLDSARRRVRQGQHAARRGVKEDKAFNNVVSKIRESATNPQKFSMKKFARGLEKEYGKGSVISKYTEKPKPQPQKKREPEKDTRSPEQREVDAQYGRSAINKKGSLGT